MQPFRWYRQAVVVTVLLIAFCASGQTPTDIAVQPDFFPRPLPIDSGAAGLTQSLKKLHTRASMLMFTAHPDDEDGGMLAYLSRGLGVRTGLATLNRGEGGQNVMSRELYDGLGLIRTEELLSADRYYGVNQFWTRAIDYGFSKSPEEALKQWGHDRVLADCVRIVRMYRPLVVSSVFVGALTDGHGNHSVAGQMAQEVFNAAGDPNMFPDQIKEGLRPWTPLKVYGRVPFSISEKGMFDYATGKYAPVRFRNFVSNEWIEGTPSTNVDLKIGSYDPVLGMSYIQVARTGLNFQKSQNGGTAVPPPGPFSSAYHRFGSRVQSAEKEQSLFDGIDTSLMGIASLAKVGKSEFLTQGLTELNRTVELAIREYSVLQPEKIAPTLAKGLKQVSGLIQQVNSSSLSEDSKYDITQELKIKQTQFNTAIVQALGLSMEAVVAPERENAGGGGPFARFIGNQETFQTAVPGQMFQVEVHAVNASAVPVKLQRLALSSTAQEKWLITTKDESTANLADNAAKDVRFSVTVPEDAAATRPYFTRPTNEQPYYDLLDSRFLNMSFVPYPLEASADFNFEGITVRLTSFVQTVKRQTGPGTFYEPLVVAPPISVSISPSSGIVPLHETSFTMSATVHSNVKGKAYGSLHLDLPSGWKAEPTKVDFSISKDGDEQNAVFKVFPEKVQEKPYTISAVADYKGREYKEGYESVGYLGIRPYNLYQPARFRSAGVDVKVAPNLELGYIVGTGDDVPEYLKDLGIASHFVSEQELATGNLQKYDVIVMGIRAYAARNDIKTYNNRLMDYVKNGGVLLVQYNTAQYDKNFGPYPYSMGGTTNVVDETTPVKILEPNHPAMIWPNKITEKDFDGWVEERGHNFLMSWDPKYTPLTETHDEGQDPQKGGLLYAEYGKGVYMYMAFAIHRQLPEVVPGSYRLLANLISLKNNPERLKRTASANGQ